MKKDVENHGVGSLPLNIVIIMEDSAIRHTAPTSGIKYKKSRLILNST